MELKMSDVYEALDLGDERLQALANENRRLLARCRAKLDFQEHWWADFTGRLKGERPITSWGPRDIQTSGEVCWTYEDHCAIHGWLRGMLS